jgi:hypothetical protein
MKHSPTIGLVLLTFALALASSATAAGPVITFNNDPGPRTIVDWGDCPTFQINATFMAQRRNETFYDNAGNPVLQRRHVSYTGTLYNPATPRNSVTYSGDFTRTTDYTTNTLTITGLSAHVVLPHQGVVLLGAGQLTVDLVSGDTVSHGPTGDLTQLCSVLA